MVLKTDFLMEQIQRFLERLLESREQMRGRQFSKANDSLQDLLRDLEELLNQLGVASDDDPHSIKVRKGAQRLHVEVIAEFGLLHSAMGGRREAQTRLLEALDRVRPLLAEADERLFTFYGTLLVNAGATCAANQDFEKAVELLSEADRVLESPPAVAQPANRLSHLRMGALLNRAIVHERLNRRLEATKDLEMAYQLSETLLAEGDERALVNVAELSRRAAVARRRQGDHDRAVELIDRALEAARDLVQKQLGPYPTVFVQTKVAAADVYFSAGRLGEGEDHIFEAIDAVPELIDTVLVAADFYVKLLDRDDTWLEIGGLPRVEVEEGFAELLAVLDVRCEDEQIRQHVRARFDLNVNNDRELAESLCAESAPEGGDPRVAALREHLVAELRHASDTTH